MQRLVATAKLAFDYWMKFAEAWGSVMMTLLFGLCYLTIFALFFPFMWLADPLKTRSKSWRAASFWSERRQTPVTLENLRRMG